MNARVLREEAERARAEAESLERLVAHKSDKASGLDSYGAPDKAEIERREAQQLQESAEEYRQKAAGLDAEAEAVHRRADELKAQEDQVRQEYEAKLKSIADERHSLLGE